MDVDGRIVLATVGGGRVVEVGGELFGLCVYYGGDEGEKHASIELSDRRAVSLGRGAHPKSVDRFLQKDKVKPQGLAAHSTFHCD